MAFWQTPQQEIVQNLMMIDERIACSTTMCSSSKDHALLIIPLWWNKAGTWE
jgi:hypothetical protein